MQGTRPACSYQPEHQWESDFRESLLDSSFDFLASDFAMESLESPLCVRKPSSSTVAASRQTSPASGCKLKRSQKQEIKVERKRAAKIIKSQESVPQAEIKRMIENRKRRGRPEPVFEPWTTKTAYTIQKIEKEVAVAEMRGDRDEVKKLKNKISSYRSRAS